MLIHEMSRDDCIRVLAAARLARLGCAQNQPYVVPVYLTYDVLPGGEPCLYGFTTPGQKVEWMRANPLVCIEVDDVVAHDQWMSVIAFGHYEELSHTAEGDDTRQPAERLLQVGRYEGTHAPTSDDQRPLPTRSSATSHVVGTSLHRRCRPRSPRSGRAARTPVLPDSRRPGHGAPSDARLADNQGTEPPDRKEGWLSRALRLVERRLPSV